jgi:hypothetical protein
VGSYKQAAIEVIASRAAPEAPQPEDPADADDDDEEALTPEEAELLRQKLERKAQRDKKRALKTVEEFKRVAKEMEPTLGNKIAARHPSMLTRLAAMLMDPTSCNHKSAKCICQTKRPKPRAALASLDLTNAPFRPCGCAWPSDS